MCNAIAIEPAAEIGNVASSSSRDLPPIKAAPPCDTWMITGELAFMAASITAFAVDDDDMLTAGIAYPLSRA